MPEHQHSLDGKNRDLTIEELKEFLDCAKACNGKSTLHVATSSGSKLRKIWINCGGTN